MENRECAYCYKPLVQREDESDHAFKIRAYCNMSCRSIRNNELRKTGWGKRGRNLRVANERRA